METKRFIRPIHWCAECGRPFYAWKREEGRCPLCRTFERFLAMSEGNDDAGKLREKS